MKVRNIAWAISLLFAGSGAWAAPVAKVLALAGDAYVTRGGQESRLALGAPLENGDSLRVADASVLQVRFVDESIISLRANSVFKIEDFAYNRNPQTDRSIFGLIRGGLRTITGLIGRNNQANYAVKGATATIGIRGTHYTIVSCTADAACLNPDGSAAPEGMYGGVTDGRIAVTNDIGEFLFGQQEYFRLAGRTAQPERLLAPPSFLSAGFEAAARGRNRGNAPATVAAAGKEAGSSGSSPQTSTSPQTTTLAPLADVLPANLQTYVPADTPAIIGGGAAPSPIVAGDGKPPTATSGLTTLVSVANPADSSQHYAGTTNFDSIQWSNSGFQKGASGDTNYIDRGSAHTAERGADGGVLEWGRWVGGPTAAGGWGNNLNFSTNQGMHYLVGTPTTDMPTNGVGIAYALLGATAPTFSDGSGNGLGLGNVTNGSAKVNFVGRTLSGGFDLAFANGNTYKLKLDGSFSGASTSGSGLMLQTAGNTNICGANGCTGTFSGFFAGTAASYLGLGYDIAANTGSPLYLNGVVALNRTGAIPTIATATGSWYHSYNEAAVGLKAAVTPIGNTAGSYYTHDVFNNFQLPAGLNSYSGILDFVMNAIGPYPDLDQAGVFKTKTASTDTGSANTGEGTLYWGRYREVVNNTALPSENAVFYTHWAAGAVVSSLPTAGAFTFSHLGGTLPTDQNGNVGNLVSGGSWSVSFLNRTLQSATPVTWNMPNGITYTLNVTTPINWTTGTLPTKIQTSPNGGTMTTDETKVNTLAGDYTICSGGCTMNNTWLSPQFHGATGTGLSLGIQTSATINGSEQLTGQVRVYGNPTPVVLATTYLFSENETRVGVTTVNAYPNPPFTTPSSPYDHGAMNALVTVSPDAVFPAGMANTPLGVFQNSFSTSNTQTAGGTTTTITLSKDAATDIGTADTSEGTYTWGRYTRQVVTNITGAAAPMGATTTSNEYAHWSYGPAVTSLPTSGSYVFTYLGGTRPTDQQGNIGTLTSPGSWSVNFNSKTLMSASPMMWSMPSGTSYELHVTSPISWAPSAPTTDTQTLTTGTMTKVATSIGSVSATPYLNCYPSCSVLDARLSPQFGGANATGLSLGITTNAYTATGQQTTGQVQIFKR